MNRDNMPVMIASAYSSNTLQGDEMQLHKVPRSPSDHYTVMESWM